MILDFHTHIFSSDICNDRKPALADSQFKCIYASEKAKIIGHQELMDAMKHSGVDYAVAMGYPWEQEDLCASQNEYLSTVIKISGGAIIPFGSVPIQTTIDIDSWVQTIKGKGLRGVGEVGFYCDGLTSSNLDYLRGLLSAAHTYSLPVCLHVNEPVGHFYHGKYDPNMRELYSALSEFPEVTIILSHWGGGMIFYELMPEVSKALNHCFYDTAASPLIYSDAIYRIASDIAGQKRILFGSDYPLLPHKRYLDIIERELDDEELKADILGKNAATLLKVI